MSSFSLFSSLSPVVRSFTNGTTGNTGVAGAKGDTGAAGIPGVKGDTGAAGIPGAKGDTGAAGIPGAKGDTGAAGIKGDTGAVGTPGVAGATGAKGDTGAVGTPGVAGATGAKGDTGAAGTPGVVGATGAAGIKGDTGTPGVAGATGVAGAVGTPGATGATGAAGITYDSAFLNAIMTSGTDFRIFKRYASFALMKSAVLLTNKYYIIHNPTNLAENGQLYYNTSGGNLSNVCNLYALTGGGQFVDGTTTINITKTPATTNMMTVSSTLQTYNMNYIIATQGIYPSRP